MSYKVLVTGSNGLLGQKLSALYMQRSDVQLLASGKGEDRFGLSGGSRYVSLDISHAAEVEDLLQRERPDVIINTAAMTNVDQCETDHEGCDALNVEAVRYLALAANKIGAHVLHLSTDFIFDGTHGPLTEEEEPHPLSYYGNAKLKGEQVLMALAQSWGILRTVLVYGVVKDMSRSNIVLWAKGSLEQGKTIHVVDDQFRTPTLAEDLAMGCMLAADKRARGVYNISGADFMSVYDLVLRVADCWNLDKTLIKRAKSADIRQPAQRPPITGFRLEKARRELGYRPHSFEEGLLLVQEQLSMRQS